MKLANLLAKTTGAGLIVGSAYLLVTNTSPDQGLIFLALIAGFILCDGSFWPNRSR